MRPRPGWQELLSGAPWFRAEGRYPIPAYSEFMPPPRLGQRAYGCLDSLLAGHDRERDPWGWPVSEYEEDFELRPGLARVARQLLEALDHLGHGRPAHGFARAKLKGNPYWPEELHGRGAPRQERYVLLLPLALARTQDDKGRVRWTLFGGSEQGPARAFWRGFFSAPEQELPAAEATAFFARLLREAYGEDGSAGLADLRRAGFRILPPADGAAGRAAAAAAAPAPPATAAPWPDDPLPSWAGDLLWEEGRPLAGVRYLLTFRPFAGLPPRVRQAYLAGDLNLLPFPGSLVFWGARQYLGLQAQLPLAAQIPLLHSIQRSEDPHGLRVPQSGWMHEPRPGSPDPSPAHGPLRATFRRTHRWGRIGRQEDELAVSGHEDKVAHVLFSTAPDDLGLYGKPMARNAQIWTGDYQRLLDGPRASRREIEEAAGRLRAGGMFGYRFFYPAMRVGPREIYWHRPLVAWLAADRKAERTADRQAERTADQKGGGTPPRVEVLYDAPLGYLTAYPAARPDPGDGARTVELWPRLLARRADRAAVELFHRPGDRKSRRTVLNVRKLLDAARQLPQEPARTSSSFHHGLLDRGYARALLHLPRRQSLESWLASLPREAVDPAAAERLAAELEACLGPAMKESESGPPESMTFRRTARRTFEQAYWRKIAGLATGSFINKDNADCVLDAATQARLVHRGRDLERLGDYLLAYYEQVIARLGLQGRALAGDLPFLWQTDFDFTWSNGWLGNNFGTQHERNLLVVIPGRDRGRAVIMADHYDTAYMEDLYGYQHGGHGPRLAAAGADDNHSATAALMLAAPIFLDLARAGRLACDVWLVHLTGEEFPSDCLGARHLSQSLVEGALRLRLPAGADGPAGDGQMRDLSATRIRGVYVLDMVAHNNDRRRDVFQICPGAGGESMWLSWQAHLANRAWNHWAPIWNRRSRRGCRRGQRSADGKTMPKTALHPALQGEVRPPIDPHSTLYNTDGQIFSDAGVPVVLFMEHYDINRHGYHDSQDTLDNIDLDYGAAVAAIAIETVARAAAAPPLPWESPAPGRKGKKGARS
ncbi:MAG TPA: M28 family peptidase [Thermoanaerobaculia bacterium]|nr:M28 family peptidase [Thermoanaerobaculia bacterium]